MHPRTGGQILVDQLRLNGVKRAFGVPGESYLAVLDALYDSGVEFVVCRQEGGAAMMAEAHGKLTGRPGVCFVTRGPGATNASAGVHVAFQDSTPMILFVGQVARDCVEREAFQEIDYRRMYGQMAKWVAQIDMASRIPEFVSRAFHVATSGRPGPVVLALPEDMLEETAAVADPLPAARVAAAPGAADLARLSALLAGARRPFAILGGGGWSEAARLEFERFAARWRLPVGVSFRCQDYFDNLHPCYAGHVGIGIDPALAARIRESDLLLVVGARLGEMTSSGYTLFDIPRMRQKLIHVFADASELGRVYQPDLPVVSALPEFAAAVAELSPPWGEGEPPWGESAAEAHAAWEAFSTPRTNPGAVQVAEAVRHLREALPPRAIVSNGAGNYAIWLHRFHAWRRFRTQLAPTSGSMGYGPPAAIAAALERRDCPVLSFSGDGCFLMTGQELATAVEHRLKIVFIVVNNGMYGTIRMHQERRYPGRVSGSQLHNPDFAAYARAFGAHGEAVVQGGDFAAALDRALAADGPALIELRIDPEALTPNASLSEIRQAALRR